MERCPALLLLYLLFFPERPALPTSKARVERKRSAR